MEIHRLFKAPHPKEKEAMVKVVETLPSEWVHNIGWLDGMFFGSDWAYGIRRGEYVLTADRVARNTRMVVHRGFNDLRYKAVKDMPYELMDHDDREAFSDFHFSGKVDVMGLVANGKLPSSVHFNKVGFYSDPEDIELAKELLGKLIRADFYGEFEMCGNAYGNGKCARERIRFSHQRGVISLEFDSGRFGKAENLDGVVEQLQALKLKEIPQEKPKSAVHGSVSISP